MLNITTNKVIAWRESTRKRASTYKDPYTGFTRSDYGLSFDAIPDASVYEMVERAYAHMLNNEVISKAGRVGDKAKAEGTPFDAFKFVHDERMQMRARVLAGELGRRSAPTVVEVDPITREMQLMAHARLAAAAAKGGRTDFPDFSTANLKIVITGKKTLGELIASLIEGDAAKGGVMRKAAEAKVEADRKAREEAASDADDDADALFEDDDEADEEEDEAA
jgi:hypothetical protein